MSTASCRRVSAHDRDAARVAGIHGLRVDRLKRIVVVDLIEFGIVGELHIFLRKQAGFPLLFNKKMHFKPATLKNTIWAELSVLEGISLNNHGNY